MPRPPERIITARTVHRDRGRAITALGVRPETEAFDTGHPWLAKALVDAIPSGWTWSAFSIGRNELPFVAASVLAGGNVRVGLEDNLWLAKGELATDEALVARAVTSDQSRSVR